MSSAGVQVGVGTRFRYDGETVEVIEMAITATGNEVSLKDRHGRVMRLAVKELLLSDRAKVIPNSPGQNRGPGCRGITVGQATDHVTERLAPHVRATYLVEQGRFE